MENMSSMMPDLYEPHGELQTKVWYLLPLRLYLGVFFLIAGFGKVKNGWLSDSSILQNMLSKSVDSPDYSFGFYRAFYHGVIEPNIGLFVFMVVLGEICSGLAFLTGTLTRWACIGAGFMLLNFFMAFDQGLFDMKGTSTRMFLVMMLVLFLGNGGLAYGVDHYLRGKVPRWMV